MREKCCTTRALKISLIVFGLLLAIGAIAAHLCQINAIAAYTMGGASALLILGVAAASIIQCVQSRLSDRGKRADSDAQDHMLHANDLQPKNASVPAPPFHELLFDDFIVQMNQKIENYERCEQSQHSNSEKSGLGLQDQMLNANERKSTSAPSKTMLEQFFDKQIVQARRDFEKFEKILRDPDEPLYRNATTLMLAPHFNDHIHQEKINHFWTYLVMMYEMKNDCIENLEKLNPNKNIIEKIKQKKLEINEIIWSMRRLRRKSYRAYVRSLGPDALLMEARRNLIGYKQKFSPTIPVESVADGLEQESYFEEKTLNRTAIEREVQQMTRSTIVTELDKICVNMLYIEMQEILSALDSQNIYPWLFLPLDPENLV